MKTGIAIFLILHGLVHAILAMVPDPNDPDAGFATFFSMRSIAATSTLSFEVMLDFNGSPAVEAGEDFIANLPEHEFTIPGQLVADATIKEVDHRFGADERMVVTAVLLLLEES